MTEKWKEKLSSEEYLICRQKHTEPPFSGEYDKFFKEGIYNCKCCESKLFQSSDKYDSGSGWPSFYDAVDKDAIKEIEDNSIQYVYKGIARRAFEQKFRLEQFVEVKDAKLVDGLLTVSLKREIPEERKPKKIPLKVA